MKPAAVIIESPSVFLRQHEGKMVKHWSHSQAGPLHDRDKGATFPVVAEQSEDNDQAIGKGRSRERPLEV